MENTDNKKSEWQERELGALWKRQPQNGGATYLAGKLDDQGVVVFSNRNKGDNPKAPDYIVYKSKEMQQQQQNSSPRKGDSPLEEEEIL